MELKVGKQLENNRTELIYKNPINNKKVAVRYFSVPNDKQDEFISELEKQNKKLNITSLIAYFGSAIGAALLACKLSKKLLPSLLYSFVGGVIGAFVSMQGLNVFVNNAQQKLFNKYDVKEQTSPEKDAPNKVSDKDSNKN